MPLRLVVDKASCQSSGRCVQSAPEAFALDADHLAEVLPGETALDDDVRLAIARGCPALAIQVLDVDGNEVDF